MTKVIGPKETALKAMKADLNIPSFLARTETDAQAEARRKKHAPKNESKGLKVITPPDPKISAAIAKDFAEKKKDEKPVDVKAIVERAQTAVTKAAKATVKAVPMKKAGKLIEKALKDREALAAKAKTAISATNSKKPVKAKKKSDGSVHRYDWATAEEAAKTGVVPKAPDMSAWTHRYFRAQCAEVEAMVKAKNIKALEAMRFSRTTGSPGMVNRYKKLALVALRCK